METKKFVSQMQAKLQNGGISNVNEIYFLIEGILGLSRADLFVLDSFSTSQQKAILKAVNARIKGKSLQLILGFSEFAGVTIKENKHTLTPRPETEYLVSLIMADKPCRVLDLCSGSGCIGLALSKAGFDVTCSDVSTKAIRSIKQNAKLNNLTINIVRSDMFDNLEGEFDIIVSNPPYIPSDDCKTLDKDVLVNDPLIALDGGVDGLDFYRQIADRAHTFLTDQGVLYLEIGINQEKSVAKLLKKHYKNITIIKDLNGVNRIIKANKKVC